jgi:23S rRNA (uridine2552-2'-O)-methyltransferase
MGRPEGERKKEHYYRAAKKHGYRSRSAYKLRQVVGAHKLLSGVNVVLELCCSPGGWTQVLRELDSSLTVVAVDIEPMVPIEGVTFVQGDITKPETFERIKSLIGGRVDLVLSDCSPKVSGTWDLDVARQLFLAEKTFEIAMKLLGRKGKVMAKVFQGRGFQEFLQTLRANFHFIRLVKPEASRRTSAEIYVLAEGPMRTELDKEHV